MPLCPVTGLMTCFVLRLEQSAFAQIQGCVILSEKGLLEQLTKHVRKGYLVDAPTTSPTVPRHSKG